MKKIFLISLIGGIMLTSISYAVGLYLGWIATVSLLEVFAVFYILCLYTALCISV